MTDEPFTTALGARLADPASSPLRPYRGDARRERPTLSVGPAGPWEATVKVVPITGAGPTTFEVHCEWTGPGLDDLGPAGELVSAADQVVVGEHALAVAIAAHATKALRVPRRPDLRALERLLRGR